MGYLYLFRGGDLWKVGISNNPQKRLATINAHSPIEVELHSWIEVPMPYWVEQDIHRILCKRRDHGEWFRLSDRHVRRIQLLMALKLNAQTRLADQANDAYFSKKTGSSRTSVIRKLKSRGVSAKDCHRLTMVFHSPTRNARF